MIFTKIFYLIGIISILCHCQEKRFVFSTLREAQNAGEFQKGWIPPVLPVGTTNISYTRNLDLNSAEGCFSCDYYNFESFEKFIKKKYNATILNEDGLIVIEFSHDGSNWLIVFQKEIELCKFYTKSRN